LTAPPSTCAQRLVVGGAHRVSTGAGIVAARVDTNDETLFEEIKRYARFGPADSALLARFAPLAAPHFERITAEFYERVREHGIRGGLGDHREAIAGDLDGDGHQLHRGVVDRRVAQSVEVLLPARGVVHEHRVGDAVEGEPLDDPGEPEAVVAVKVRDEHAVHGAGGEVPEGHLPLGPLARVEEKSLVVPAEEIAVVVALPGGHLAAGAEREELSKTHGVRGQS
jgi:hypothetical protein